MGDLEALFRREYAGLVRAATFATGDPDAAADAVQEAFVQAHLRWRRLRSYDDPVGWVRRTAMHRAANERRRRGRRDRATRRLGAIAGAGVPDAGATIEDRIVLLDAVARLPNRQRQVVGLYYGADLSVGSIAAALGISEGTVKSTLSDARRALRSEVEVIDGPAR